MTKCNKLFITYRTRSTEQLPSSIEYFNRFNHFNDGSYDYVIQKAVTKTYTHAQRVACNIRCVVWADISR